VPTLQILVESDDNFYGDCRLNPPVVFEPPAEKHATVARSSIRGHWPSTNAEDWCGQFRQKGEEKGEI